MVSSFSVRHAPCRARAHSVMRFSPVLMIAATCAGALAQTSAPVDIRLQPVSVTATRFAQNAVDLPFGVSVLEADEIKASGVTTVNEAIMKLLGVPGRLDSYGGGDYGLDLRGFGITADSNQVVVIDGIRINEADLGGTRLAGISIDSVERIEVIRGSGAVLYGEGATGGVIVITTKAGRGTARKNQADVYAAAGSYGVRELRGNGTVVAGNFSLDVAANKRDADNHRDNFRSKVDGASVTGQWSNDWLRAGVRHATDHLDTGLPGGLSQAKYDESLRQTGPFGGSTSASIRNNRNSMFGQAVFGEWQVGLDAGWRDKTLTGSYGSYDVNASTYALRTKYATKFGGIDNSLTAGIDHDEWKRTGQGAGAAVANQRSEAVYLKDEVTLASGTRMSAGWRTESLKKDNSGGSVSVNERPNAWEIGVVQPVIAGLSVFGRMGHSFRSPNVDEFGFTTPGLTLQIQTSRDIELGGRWAYVGGRAELRMYSSVLSNEIGYDPNAVGPSSAFGYNGANVNFDPTRRQGIEIEVAQVLSANANVRVNAAARRARFTAGTYDGKDVPLTPRHTLSVRADWAPALGHRIDGGVNIVSSQSPDFNNACRMPSYTTADLRYAYQWSLAELAVGVNNLGNTKYYTLAFSCKDGVVGGIYPEAGRAITASVRLHF